ncbi:MAG: TIGR00730 family Rossman fold protein [Spirochaetia bacterium]|nr:TIGR00730 family Rossman fold protein [Spirochaetia bacterium]
MRVCVYCSSSDALPRKYFKAAKETGKLIGGRGHSLVYGGGKVGLMGEVANAVMGAGGRVTGVIPTHLKKMGVAHADLHELIETPDMRKRKEKMEKLSDAFIFLPGGIGTLEEASEIITLKQLHYHNKAIVLLNSHGYYNPLLKFFREMIGEKFIKKDFYKLFIIAKTAKEAIEYIEKYEPVETQNKWF